jgi:hypothetical protein
MQIIQPLTDSQILHTQTSIQERTAQLQAVEVEYAKLQRKLSTLDQKRRDISQSIFEYQARLGIMRKVPQDILSIIFEFFVLGEKESPWTLMQIDRKWRQTALQTRSIWSRIEITPHVRQKKGHHRSRDGRERCTTEDQLVRALKRAGTSYLDIKICAIAPNNQQWTNKAESRFKKIIVALDRLGGNESGGLRIARLDIIGMPHSLPSKDIVLPFKEIIFPHLREFRMHYLNNEALFQYVASSASRLENLDIDFLYRKSMDPSYAWWSKLKSFKLQPTYVEPGISRSDVIPPVLSKARSLEHLELIGFNRYSFLACPLPCLQILTTDAWIGKAQINTPLLTQLRLVRLDSHKSTPNNCTDQIFPSLRHLDVEIFNRRLRYLQAPALHTLIIRPPTYKFHKPSPSEVWFDEVRPNVLNPTILHIVKTLIHRKALMRILSSMSAVEELYIQGITAKIWLFNYLGQPIKQPKQLLLGPDSNSNSNTDPNPTNSSDLSDLGDNSTELESELEQAEAQKPESERNTRWPLPSLKKLSIDISGRKQATDVNNDKKFRSAAKRCLQGRRKAGIEMESVRIKVTRDDPWMEIL